MASSQEFGSVHFGVGTEARHFRPSPETPFRILVLGDFSGSSGRKGEQGRPPRPIPVSRDNIDELPGRLGTHCEVGIGDAQGETVTLRFGRLADFHPDSLPEKVPLLARLKAIHGHLRHPATFEKAAAEVRTWGILGHEAAEAPPAPLEPSPTPTERPPHGSLLEQAFDMPPAPAAAPRRGAQLPEPLAQIVRRSTEALRVPKAAEEAPVFIAAVEALIGRTLRAVLHDPEFQAMEAAWRGLDFLVKRLPTGPNLKVLLVDLGMDAVKAELGLADSLEATSLYKILVDETSGVPGAEPWGLIVANYTFEPTAVDLLVAGCLARMAEGAGAPLLAAASPGLLGCPTAAQLADPSGWQPDLPAAVAKAWDALRGRPEATRLGLVVPRFLLRMPYGAESCPLESLPFTELPDPEDHDGYLWGNPALVGGVLLGCAFSEQGWGFDPSRALAMEDLPLYTFERDGEYCAKPCAETLLSQRVAERILAAGLMPLLPVRGSGSALLAAWQSVHASGAALQLRSAGS